MVDSKLRNVLPEDSKNTADAKVILEEGYSVDELDEQEVEFGLDWKKQLRPRSIILGAVIGTALCIVYTKIALTLPMLPSMNVAAGILSYSGMKSALVASQKVSNAGQSCTSSNNPFHKMFVVMGEVLPYSKQENTVIQTTAVALLGTTFAIGVGTYYMAMAPQTAAQMDDTPAWTQEGTHTPTYLSLMALSFCVAWTGIFLLVGIRKLFVIDLRSKLIFPSGTATGAMISNFFVGGGSELASKQFNSFMKWGGFQFFWDLFQWFFTGDGCPGFDGMPNFGINALNKWDLNFNFEFNVVGIGMIVPDSVNIGIFLGSILCSFLWPSSGLGMIPNDKWYPGLSPSSMEGQHGLQVFTFVAILFGDGFYQIGKLIFAVYQKRKGNDTSSNDINTLNSSDMDEEDIAAKMRQIRINDKIFTNSKSEINKIVAVVGVLLAMALGTAVIPEIFKNGPTWYMILVSYLIVPLVAIPNVYLIGMTDTDVSAIFAKLPLILMAMWGGSIDKSTGMNAGLLSMGAVLAGSTQAGALMQDFKTGWITGSSPKAMFYAQIIGTFLGCFIAPAIFFMFYSAFPVGYADSAYPAPFALAYRSIAYIGVQGFDALPKYCTTFMGVSFGFSIVWSIMLDYLTGKTTALFLSQNAKSWLELLLPSPMSFGLGLYMGGSFGVPFLFATIVKRIWKYKNAKSYENYYLMVASGLIVGDGIWSFVNALMALAGLQPPICMDFKKATNN